MLPADFGTWLPETTLGIPSKATNEGKQGGKEEPEKNTNAATHTKRKCKFGGCCNPSCPSGTRKCWHKSREECSFSRHFEASKERIEENSQNKAVDHKKEPDKDNTEVMPVPEATPKADSMSGTRGKAATETKPKCNVRGCCNPSCPRGTKKYGGNLKQCDNCPFARFKMSKTCTAEGKQP